MQPRGMSTVNAPLENLRCTGFVATQKLRAQLHCRALKEVQDHPPIQLRAEGQPGVREQAQGVDGPLKAVGIIIVGLQALRAIMVAAQSQQLLSRSSYIYSHQTRALLVNKTCDMSSMICGCLLA